ncbi:MAG: NAD(P)/FAD-dependent oxidoreductase [Lentihominibacter sp.]
MRYRAEEIKIRPRDVAAREGGIDSRKLIRAISDKLSSRYRINKPGNITIVRESVDARKKPDVKLVYSLDFDCGKRLPLDPPGVNRYSHPGNVKDVSSRPVIAGFGPCGIFAALVLAQAGMKPVVLERGKAVPERVADVERFWESNGQLPPDPESNVQFGEGGAGTFSDGKLTTGIKDPRIRKVLESFVEAGADEEILYKAKPHIGTDKLREVVVNLRRRIEELGGEVRFSTRLDEIIIREGRLEGVITSSGETLETDSLILAVGHSARDTFEMLDRLGFEMKQKPFSIGVRIEHPQEMINISRYGDAELAGILGPADYKLNCRCESGRGVYTFCMCPGGYVVNASTEAGTSVTNGMSNAARDSGTANSALLVDVRPEDFALASPRPESPLAGIDFQMKYEKLAWENRTEHGMAESTYGSFRNNPGDSVRKSLPAFAWESICEAMPILGRKLEGFDREDAVLTGVETRSSSPLRVIRDENMETSVRGIIPAGEGPGYAGGIMSAAVDGIKAAEAVIRRHLR